GAAGEGAGLQDVARAVGGGGRGGGGRRGGGRGHRRRGRGRGRVGQVGGVGVALLPLRGALALQELALALLLGARAGGQLGVGHGHFLARQQVVELVARGRVRGRGGVAGRGRGVVGHAFGGLRARRGRLRVGVRRGPEEALLAVALEEPGRPQH